MKKEKVDKLINITLALFGLFIAYQIIRKLLGGSWQVEDIIIGLLMLNLGLTWKLNMGHVSLRSDFKSHIKWHKREKK